MLRGLSIPAMSLANEKSKTSNNIFSWFSTFINSFWIKFIGYVFNRKPNKTSNIFYNFFSAYLNSVWLEFIEYVHNTPRFFVDCYISCQIIPLLWHEKGVWNHKRRKNPNIKIFKTSLLRVHLIYVISSWNEKEIFFFYQNFKYLYHPINFQLR